ncbi:hypothetical protein DRQ32_10860 [bacterium]|nr:MAG: hypothetical protein DRQ32_10860 [bacterium]
MTKQAQFDFQLSSLLNSLFRAQEHVYLAQRDGTKFHQHRLVPFTESDIRELRGVSTPLRAAP